MPWATPPACPSPPSHPVWEARVGDVARGRHYRIASAGELLSFRELFALLENDPDFADWYGATLAACPYRAFFWEHPALDRGSFDREAEFVLIDAPSLAGLAPQPEAFAAHFAREPDADVVRFGNLGGDALLIAPRALTTPETYAHLAVFLRGAPGNQQRSLWRHAAAALADALGPRPRWLSTSGLGVTWLHLRIDATPKYYQHTPYRAAPR